MPLPLLPRSSKPETKKSPCSRVVPTVHEQYEKKGKNYQAKISPSSPQGALKKRLAFEDLTNASQSQFSQLKKKANKEFVKDVFKKTNRSTHALGLARNEMNLKGYKPKPSPLMSSTPLVPNNMEQPLILEISTISKTPTTEKASPFTKPLIFKEEATTEETAFIKKSLSLKKHICHEEVSLLVNPQSLQEETDKDDKIVIEPVTSRKKNKTEEAPITKGTLSLNKKMYTTYQGKQSCLEELLALQDISVEEDSFFMESMNFRKKPKTEQSNPTKKLLLLKKNKCTTQGLIPCLKPLVLQKTTSGEKSLMKEALFLKEPTTEESLFQEPSDLQEKDITEQEMPILKKSLALQERTNFKEDSLIKELLAFKKKATTEEAPMRPLYLKKKCITQSKISHLKKTIVLQKTTSGEKSLTTNPLSVKKKPTAEESFIQEPSPLQGKHITQGEVDLLKKPWGLQGTINSEDNLVWGIVSFKKQHTIKESAPTKKPLPLKKKKATTHGKMYYLKNPLVLQKTVSGEKSLMKKPLSFKRKPATEGESFHQKPSLLPEKHTTQGKVSTLQNSPTKEESLFKEALVFKKKHTFEDTTSTRKPLPLKKEHTTQGTMSCLKKSLKLQKTTSGEKSLTKEPFSFREEKVSLKKKECTTQVMTSTWQELLDSQDVTGEDKNSFFMEPMSFRKNPTTEEAILTNRQLSLEKKKITQGKVFILKKPLILQKTTTKEESLYKELLSFKKKPTTEEEFLFHEPSGLKEKHTILQGVSLSKELLALQEATTEEKSYIKELLTLKEKPDTEEEFRFQELFSLHVKPTNKDESFFQKTLVLQAKTDTKEDSLKNLLALQEKSTIEEKFPFKKLLVLRQEPSTEAVKRTEEQLSLKKKPTAQEEVFLLKKQLALHENITTDEESLIKQPLALQKYPIIKKEALFKEPFVMQEKPSVEEEAIFKEPTTDTEAHFKEPLALQEQPSIEETCFKEPLALQEKPTIEEEATLKEPMAMWEKPSIEKETLFKENFVLQEKSTMEEEILLKEPLALQEKPSIEKEALFKEPLALQEKPTFTEAFLLTKILPLSEKSTIGKELSFKEPLTLDENPTQKEDTFLKTLISQVDTSPQVSIIAPEYRTGKSSTATMSSVGKCSTTSKSSTCEFGSNKLFSPQGERTPRTPKEMSPLLEDIDNSIYAKDIFIYMKEREENFILRKYMDRQTEINSTMRAILVDWLVEVQISTIDSAKIFTFRCYHLVPTCMHKWPSACMKYWKEASMSFEMNHETLYLTVKLVDHYLMEVDCKKDNLQLLGSTAFLIAAKFQETYLPCVDDFLYICDDMYKRDEMLAMEKSILKTLKFEINIPVAYHFLRIYARCVHANMKTLTLSRFICELTLQEYDYIQERASKLAAGSFLLALYMKKLGHWAPILEYYSGYKTSELHPLVMRLNLLLTFCSCHRLKTVHFKYSHQVFFEVAKIPPLDMLKLEEMLNC
ncbi:G2/mitotic-specific cyclin-B3 [Nycticebus coucang]|uniref:G2/mitotic-specific cyclin-B3 n=1 Tax=Nycticebus coucang TaxID=9470 RepID=UPI00234DF7FE|nr:G2/mitotic-specific cyclin-B3 [Nycticebus coucang]